MYLLILNEQGKPIEILKDAEYGLDGCYLEELPIPLEELLSNGVVEEVTKDNKKIYKIKGV